MILRRNEAIMELGVGNTVCLRSFRKKRQWTVTICSRENWKRFKNCPCFCQTCDFAIEVSRQVKPLKHSKTKFWKNFLSVFRDWKIYPWGSRELSRENLWVTLATRPSTREQVAKIDPRTCDWGPQLDLLAIESPKQGKRDFWNFSVLKNKILSKNTFQNT